MLKCLSSLLRRCNARVHLRQVHAHLITSGLAGADPFAWKFLSFAAASSAADIDYAYSFFLHLLNPTLFHYNAIIRGVSNNRSPIKAVSLFTRMLRNSIAPDHMTYPFLIKASARVSDAKLGGSLHGLAQRGGFAADVFILNSLIHMYGSCGEIGSGRKVFDEMPMRTLVSWNSILDGYGKCGDVIKMQAVFDKMPKRDVVSWSALVDGYVKDGDYAKALVVFSRMRAEGPRANEVTMVSVLCACSHLGALEQGRAMHRYVMNNALPLTLMLRTSLVDMYAKCGAIEEALAMFRGISREKTDVLIWNAMIGGLASHGCTMEALKVYHEMQVSSIKPDEITYLCLLCACAHGGLVEEAWKYFDSITKDGMVPKSEHYACMVDVLARAGRVGEAYRFVSEMPVEPTASMLGALINGCINHRKLDLAEVVGKRLLELDPGHDGRYIGLSNVYAGIKRWDEAKNMREAMESRGVRKFPGCSYIEVFGSLHRFIAHDTKHPEMEEIYFMLHVMVEEMKLKTDPRREEIICIPDEVDHLKYNTICF